MSRSHPTSYPSSRTTSPVTPGRASTPSFSPRPRAGRCGAPTFHKSYRKARHAAGRPDLRFHDLRHTGAVLAAATGATLAELMQRLGHTTAGAAMRYQHAARDRDAEIAETLSRIAAGA